ncbi:MAG TPA: hypothetical protein VM367_14690 [Pseudonocardia sp.]|jgi:hypothetical protein|nr:hypothetical protein [Pseudonocardia sp.]
MATFDVEVAVSDVAHLVLPPPPSQGDVGPVEMLDRGVYRAAAGRALRVLPGPLGQLVARELIAYADFGYRFRVDALVPRLAAHVLALPLDRTGDERGPDDAA